MNVIGRCAGPDRASLRSLNCQLAVNSDSSVLVWTPVLIVPITIGPPTVFVFIPPPVVLAPAMLASFAQLVSCALGLFAVPAVVLDGLVKPVVGLGDPLLAFVLIGPAARCAYKQQKTCKTGDCKYPFPREHCSEQMRLLHLVSSTFISLTDKRR
jgi:hypothetical protein